jgi:hypothetical protein
MRRKVPMSSPDRGSRSGPGSSAGRGCLSAAVLAVGLLITVVIGYCGGGGVIHLFWRVVTGRAAHGDAEAMVVIAIITAVLLACGIGLIMLGIRLGNRK